jgi:hypothetical protein
MATPPVRERHYQKPARLMARTKGDLSDDFLAGRRDVGPFIAPLGDPKPAAPSLISSAHGSIDEILLTIPAYAAESSVLARAYQDLLAKLPSSTRFRVLTHESAQISVGAWFAGRTARIVLAPDHLNFSVWAEDGYVVVRDQPTGETFFVEPFAFPRYGDSLIADFISSGTGTGDTQAPLYFQGGNVLIGDDFFLIGADYPAETLRQYLGRVIVPNAGESGEAAVRRLYTEYLDTARRLMYVGATIPVPAETIRDVTIDGQQWRELLYFGNRPGTSQPLFHIDMFISLAGRGPAGKYRLLVGDPKRAADALGEPARPHAMQEVFDNIARRLGQLGFEVIRNPLPLAYMDDPAERLRTWYFATGNNALVEIVPGSSTVWLPTYGHGDWAQLSAIDAANAGIWESLGFTVRMLGDFHAFAENLGAVHCIKKYLARGQA